MRNEKQTKAENINIPPRARLRRVLPGLLALVLLLTVLLPWGSALAASKNRRVRVGFFAYPGYHEINDGVRSGYGYDFLMLLQRYTDLEYEFVGYDCSWEQMQEMLVSGEIDMVTSARKTPEREQIFDFSMPIGTNSVQINVRADDDRFIPGDNAALNGITIGVLRGSSRNADLKKYAEEMGFAYIEAEYDTAEALDAALQAGEVDAIATSSLRKSSGERTVAEFAPESFFVIVKKGNEALLTEVNYGITQMNAYEGNWTADLYYANYYYVSHTGLFFTPRELAYIAAVKSGEIVITVTAQPDRDPYSFVENGQLTGIIPDYFAHLMSMAGLPYTVIVPKDRDEFEVWTRTNRTDIVMDCRYAAAPSVEDEDSFGLVTEPYMTLTVACVTRKGFTGTVRVIATVDSQGADYIEASVAGDAEYLIVPTREAAMAAVSEGKADACYVYTYMAEKYINADPNSNLQFTILKSPVYNEYIYVSPEADHELASILTKCIRADASGMLDEYVKKYTAVTYGDITLGQYLKLHPWYVMIAAAVLAVMTIYIAVSTVRGRTVKMKNAQLESERAQQQKLSEALTFTNFFLDSYLSAYYVDLNTCACQTYKRTDALEEKYPVKLDYFSTLSDYIEHEVHPDDRAELLDLVRPERMKQMLRQSEEYIHIFRSLSHGREKTLRMQVIRGADADHAAFGFMDITEELKEQQQHFLGAVPLSPGILGKANIGLWAFELDEGKPPRMYGDETMLTLVGLDHQVPPEEMYHAWYDHIDEDSYGLVTDAVAKMTAGEHAEVQYPWHHPDGSTLIVRCGGVRNPEYKSGIRIEGTHQNVTAVLHFDEEKIKKEQEDLTLMLMTVLSDSYTSLYYVDPETGAYQLITKDEEYDSKVMVHIEDSGCFYDDCRASNPRVVYPEDLPKLRPFETREGLAAAFAESDTFSVDYRLLIDGAAVWYRIKAVRVRDAANGIKYALGVMNISGLREQEELQKRNREIIEILASEYTSVYYIDLTTGGLTPYTMNESTESAFGNVFRSGISYSEAYRMYVAEQVLAEDRTMMLDAGSVRNIMKELRGKKTFLTTYRDANGHFSEMKFVKVGDEKGKPLAVALGFADKDEELRAQQEAETVRQRNIDIIEILASEYSSVYYIDLTTDELDPYTMNEETESEFGRIFRSGIHYSDAFRMYVDNLVYAEDRKRMLEAGSVFNILKELADKKTFITTYRSENGGDPHYCEMKFVKVGEEENPRAVALGFADKDEELREKMRQEEIAARDAAVISGLSDDFGCVVYVDDETAEEVHYRFDPLLSANVPGWEQITNYEERMRTLGETVVHPDDKWFFLEPEKQKGLIFSELLEQGVFYHNFRIVINAVVMYYQVKIIPDEHSDHHIIAGLRNVDSTVKREMEYQEKLEAANRSKTDFLFNMSHDIRTPMNAIIGFTQLAEKHIDDRERTTDCLQKIESAGNHLLNLINEVLDMSRVEAGKLHSEMKTVNINEAAERLVTICRETAAERNITLTYRDMGIRHPVVSADELHINQIIMNIVGNAIKYTEPGGSITYTASETDSEVPGYGRYVFTVSDTGIGMSKEFLGRIFDSFSREENASTSEIQGTGLGMTIVKRLVDYLDGNIDIESEIGKGTKVTVSLYLKYEEQASEAAVSAEQRPVVLKGKKVLLVEDNELNREIATEMLEEQGLLIETAENGQEAVEHVKERGAKYFDLILMDIQMPFMNGYEATREIRKLPDAQSLPIIALSANAFEEDKRMSLEAGMNDHVAKPIVIAELLNALAKFIK